MTKIYLKESREKSLKNKHPWIFKSAIKPAKAQNGEIVQVCTGAGKSAALAFYSGSSQICLRIFSWDPMGEPDRDFWREKIRRAVSLRSPLRTNPDVTDSCRLIFGEADGLPGLVADLYRDYLSVQFLTAGMDRLKDEIVTLLAEEIKPRGIIEKSDEDMRKREGLAPAEGLLWGEEMPRDYAIRENGLNYGVDLATGQKTGFY
ncbi:MAG: hypothetical protein JXA95_00985, partial [Spirochaetales bacterium]|nr:hypothetical protein [Spirochaetales bacterium]